MKFEKKSTHQLNRLICYLYQDQFKFNCHYQRYTFNRSCICHIIHNCAFIRIQMDIKTQNIRRYRSIKQTIDLIDEGFKMHKSNEFGKKRKQATFQQSFLVFHFLLYVIWKMEDVARVRQLHRISEDMSKVILFLDAYFLFR